MSRYFRTVALNRIAPESEDNVFMVPADFMARVICEMGHLRDNYFHFVSPKGVTVNEISTIIENKLNLDNQSKDIKVKLIDRIVWRDTILENSKLAPDHPLLLPELLKTKDEDYEDDYQYDPNLNVNTLQRMKEFNLEYPIMTEGIIFKYLDFIGLK